MMIPDSARIIATDSGRGPGLVSLDWPGCEDCSFSVSVTADSGIDLERRIERLLAEQRRIDSVNRDPRTTLYEFDAIEGPPRPFSTSVGKGYLIDESCGDCGSSRLVFARPGQIATVRMDADNRVDNLPRLFCEMTVIGKTFQWWP